MDELVVFWQANRPLIILAAGVATVVGMIMVLKINAFIALITAALVVSLLAPPPAVDESDPSQTPTRMGRVAIAFGETAGKIAIVIGLAAVIGECMMVSGAADRIVLFFLKLLGERRAGWALMLSGFVLAVPVFFDTVFYLLVPLARSMYKRTGRNYLLSLLAIAAGGAITHSLAPPTPGPLAMAANLHFDVGVMILVGIAVGLPASIAGLLAARVFDRVLNVPFRELAAQADQQPLEESELPPLGLSLLPVVLPVVLISANTIVTTMLKQPDPAPLWQQLSPWTANLGDANFAMLVSTAIAFFLLWWSRRPSLLDMARTAEVSLMSGGVIILITSGGGAFGAMLQQAQIGDAIQSYFETESGGSGLTFLLMAFLIASLMKFAQGSGTVSMVTTSAMMWGMLNIGDDVTDKVAAARDILGMHPVYLACAIGAGSLVGSWMNDSGFWIFAKMGGLTEGETLRSWTLMLMLLGLASMAVTLVLASVYPMA